MGDNGMDNRGRYQLNGTGRLSFYTHAVNDSISNAKSANKRRMEVKILLAISIILGYPATIYTILANITQDWHTNWKSNVLVVLVAAWWLFKIYRAWWRWTMEKEEKKIELEEKRRRYERDIFT